MLLPVTEPSYLEEDVTPGTGEGAVSDREVDEVDSSAAVLLGVYLWVVLVVPVVVCPFLQLHVVHQVPLV